METLELAAPLAATANLANKGNSMTQYDMLAAITQNTINMQFSLLWKELSDEQHVMSWQFEDTDPDIGLTLHYKFQGRMDAPTVVLGTSSSPNFCVKLCVNIPEGTLTYGSTTAKTINIENWKYVFDVDVNFTAIAQNQIALHKAIPDVVKKMLQSFNDNQFTINHLFMNFQDANIAAYDENLSSLPLPEGTSKVVVQFFQTGITEYFRGLKKDDNPYILGFQIDDSAPARDQSIPPTFTPTSGTYWIFKEMEAQKQGLSTLNILTTTNNRQLPVKTQPNFTNNWVVNNDCDGRFVVASSRFMEDFIIKQLTSAFNVRLGGAQCSSNSHMSTYTRYHDVVWNKDNAPSAGNSKWKFTYNKDSSWVAEDVGEKAIVTTIYIDGHHTITNSFEFNVALENVNETTARINLSGYFYIKHNLKCYPFGLTEEVWESVKQAWTGSITIEGGTMGALKLTSTAQKGNKDHDQGGNWLGKVDVALGGLDNLEDMVNWCMGELEDKLQNFENLFSSLNNRFVLPAGSVFAFVNPQFDEYQNLLTYISYKTQFN